MTPLRTSLVPTLLAGTTLLACAAPPAPPSTSARGPALAGLKIETVAADEGATPEVCPAAAGTGLAMLAGLDLDAAVKPVLSVSVGCESGFAPNSAGTTRDEPGSVTVSVGVTLDLATPGHPDESYDGAGMATCTDCGGGKAPGRVTLAVARAVREAVDLALGQARVSRVDDGALAALLAAPDRIARSVLLAALEEAGMRRLRAALDPAARLLDADDDEVALRAVGVLSRLQDPAALRALGRAALTKRPEIPFAAVRAMADIDGPDARRALELVSAQAADPVLAREARDLLDEITEGGKE